MRCQIDKNPANWDNYVRTSSFAANNTVHRGTKYTPNELLFGRTSIIPVVLTKKPGPTYNQEDTVGVLINNGRVSWEAARTNLGQMKSITKKNHDRILNQHVFHVGDQVLIKAPPRTKKLEQKYMGPYTIIHILSEQTVEGKGRLKNTKLLMWKDYFPTINRRKGKNDNLRRQK